MVTPAHILAVGVAAGVAGLVLVFGWWALIAAGWSVAVAAALFVDW